MAKRDRVPRRKQLGEHQRNRNKTPKLSPYQREQKRDRLANQPPVNKITRDFPASARKLQHFLNYQRELRDEAEETRTTRQAAASPASSSSAAAPGTTPAVPKSKNKFKQGTMAAPASLNAKLLVDSQPADQNPIVKRLEKKMKLAQKKKEKRKMLRIEQMHAESDRLDAIMSGRPLEAAALRTVMRSTRRLKRRPTDDNGDDDGAGQEADAGEDAGAPSAPVAPPPPPPPPPKPVAPRTTKDFDDLVDYVKFGDRNDAPPTFDVIPKTNVALIPQQHIGKAKRAQLVEKHRRAKIEGAIAAAAGVVTSQGPLVTTTRLPDGSELVAATVKGTRLESTADFEALRERVMARYAKKNQNFFQKRRNTIFDVGGDADDI